MKTTLLASLFLGLALSATAQSLPPRPWEVSAGLTYVTGDYGLNADTDVWVQTTSLSHDQDAWKFTATVPVIRLSGPSSIIGDVGRPGTSSVTGLGDVSVAAAYKIIDPATGTSDFDFTTRLKLPTADENKGLGTGETDVNLELNYHRTAGATTPFATLGYRFLGSSPAYPLRDGFYATVGVAAPLTTEGTVGGLAFTWREKIVANSEDALEAMAFISHALSERTKLQTFVLTGFSDASPNFGIGAQLGYKF